MLRIHLFCYSCNLCIFIISCLNDVMYFYGCGIHGGPKLSANCILMLKTASEVYFFAKLCRHTSTVISLGVKYSMRDLICDINYCAWNAKLMLIVMYGKCLQSFPIEFHSETIFSRNSHKNSLIIWSFHLQFYHIHLLLPAVSRTAINNVTYYSMRRICNTNVQYWNASIAVRLNEKPSLIHWF